MWIEDPRLLCCGKPDTPAPTGTPIIRWACWPHPLMDRQASRHRPQQPKYLALKALPNVCPAERNQVIGPIPLLPDPAGQGKGRTAGSLGRRRTPGRSLGSLPTGYKLYVMSRTSHSECFCSRVRRASAPAPAGRTRVRTRGRQLVCGEMDTPAKWALEMGPSVGLAPSTAPTGPI